MASSTPPRANVSVTQRPSNWCSDEIGYEATADVEHLHPGRDARGLEEAPGGRFDQTSLLFEAVGLPLGPPHHVDRIARGCLLHASLLRMSPLAGRLRPQTVSPLGPTPSPS